MERNYLCIDVGGTGMKYAVCKEDGEMISRGKVDLEDSGGVFGPGAAGLHGQ